MNTETIARLVNGLELYSVSQDTTEAILLMLPDEQQKWNLMHWMADHEGATEPQIFEQAVELMDARTTRMMSPEEKSQSSSNVAPRPGETWGAFFARLTPEELSDWYDDSLDGLWEMRAKKKRAQAEAATASTAPIIEDGKTLDELVKGDKYMERITRDSRAEGATDQEIWQFAKEN
ncbi:MAG: hypothetical protein ACI3XD_03730 [Oscillospiraceae bacterium]